jgi:heme-degrading monooxygenase HmoA
VFVRVWEFEVRAEQVGPFVSSYAADGAWTQLFARGDGYIDSRLYRDADDARRFVTVDRWRDLESWQGFLDRWSVEYEALDRHLDELTDAERLVIEGSL